MGVSQFPAAGGGTMTAAQIFASLASAYTARTVLVASAQDLAVTLPGGDGEADFDIDGYLVVGSGGPGNVTLQPGTSTANQLSDSIGGGDGGLIDSGVGATLGVMLNLSVAFEFSGYLRLRTGMGRRFWTCTGTRMSSTAGSRQNFATQGEINDAVTAYTTVRLHSSVALGLGPTSWLRAVRKIQGY